jgi:hypothetical protein
LEYANPLRNELYNILPKAAKILCVTTHHDLVVFEDINALPARFYPKYKYPETIVKTIEVNSGEPFVKVRALHSGVYVGYGFILYRNHFDPSLQYLVYSTQNPNNGACERYLIAKKKEIGKLYRLWHKAEKLANVNEKPILDDSLLDDIVNNTVGFLINARKLKKYGIRIKRGVILHGLAGNGKTLTCRYIQKLCSQRGINHGIVTSSAIETAYANDRVEELFSQHEVTFFDDINIELFDRTSARANLACAILSAMDGMGVNNHTIRIFTTNEDIANFDPAFNRPGRIDRIYKFVKPTSDLRRKLINTWSIDILPHINIEDLVLKTEGMSFAEVEDIKATLVSNYLLGGFWDVDKAVNGILSYRIEKKRGLGLQSGGELATSIQGKLLSYA